MATKLEHPRANQLIQLAPQRETKVKDGKIVHADDESPVCDPDPKTWPPRRSATPEFIALTALFDRDEKIRGYINRCLKEEPIRQPELKDMLGLLLDAYFDLNEKCELAMNAADLAKKESAMNRRHTEHAIAIADTLLGMVGQKNPSATAAPDGAPSEASPASPESQQE